MAGLLGLTTFGDGSGQVGIRHFFGIVADEIRKLSETSARSVESIRAVTKSIVDHLGTVTATADVGNKNALDGASIIKAGSSQLQAILDATDVVARQMEQVATANKDMADTAKRMADSVGAQRELADSVHAHVAKLQGTSKELRRAVSAFRIDLARSRWAGVILAMT